MGNNSSSRQEYLNEQYKLEAEALRKFNIRVKGYSYPHHGPYITYINLGLYCNIKITTVE